MAEKRVEFASTKRVDEFREEVSEVLRCSASILKEPEDTEEEWLSYAFVSDESRLADFFYDDSELAQLERLCGMNRLKMRDLICDVAYSLYQTKRTRESKTPLWNWPAKTGVMEFALVTSAYFRDQILVKRP